MGVQPSKTELFLPSDTLRRCDPDRCWCDRPYHRKSRYVYVERGGSGDGSERYHDPMDMMSNMMTGGMPTIPWKDPRSWTVRDYDRLGEVLEEFYNRERGRRATQPPPGYGPYPTWPMPPPQYPPSAEQPWGEPQHHRRRSNRPGWSEYNRLEEQFRHMYDEYMKHRNENDSVLYGSDVDRRKDQYRYNMMKTLQEMWPQLNQMVMAQQQMHQQNPMMHQQMPLPQQMHQGYMPQQPMMPGMQPNMYPGMAGPAYGMPPMNQGMMAPGMNGGYAMPPPNGVDYMGTPPMRKPWRRPPESAFVEDYHNDFDGRPRPYKGGWGRDRYGPMGGGFGDGTRSSDDPLGPVPPRPPRGPKPGGGGLGSGGAVFDNPPGFFRDTGVRPPMPPNPRTPNDLPRVPVPPRSSPMRPPPPLPEDLAYSSQPPYTSSMYTDAALASGGLADVPLTSATNGRPSILRTTTTERMSRTQQPFFGTQSMPYPSDNGYPYVSGTMDGMQTGPDIVTGQASVRPSVSRKVSFQPEAGLARSRDEEEARGEAEAGAPLSKRDGL